MPPLHINGEQWWQVWQLPLERQGEAPCPWEWTSNVSLLGLEAGGLTVVGGGPRKGKKLPSLLEGPALLWPGAMVEKRRLLPERLWVWCESQERVLVVYWW